MKNNCNGGDIGVKEGGINTFCYVIDVDSAKMTIKKGLGSKNLLDGATVAYLDANEEYISIYPEGATFSL